MITEMRRREPGTKSDDVSEMNLELTMLELEMPSPGLI